MFFRRSSLGTVSATSPSVQALVNAIAQQEGPVQGNNPGNLLYVGQPGATGADSRGFAIFSSLQSGQQAEANQIALDVNRGTCATGSPVSTLNDLIAGCLTPASLNPNVSSYVQAVSAQTGIDPNAALSVALQTGVSSAFQPLAAGSGGSADISGDNVASDLSGIDFSDPTTLVLVALLGGVAWLAFRR